MTGTAAAAASDTDRALIAPAGVIWETTRACGLACLHCRAAAGPGRALGELGTGEGKELLSQIAAMGTRVVTLAGGDPLERADIFDLVRHGKACGLRVHASPAATPALTEEVVRALRDADLDQLVLALDFPRADLHDHFRGRPGVFARTMAAIAWGHRQALPLQIDTLVCRRTLPHLAEVAALVAGLDVVRWQLFFLVPVGRGAEVDQLSPWDCETAFGVIRAAQHAAHFVVGVTEAPHYRRYLATRAAAAGDLRTPEASVPRPEIFVSHLGDVHPSPFLPLRAGNVRARPLADIYRDAPIFRALRDPSRLRGRCGRCEYRVVCGGSRARAHALRGDVMAPDPWCAYRPTG